ncbi:MAG TPA: hypothetical protein VIM19_18915, partial [Actinomycetes bacterium]
RALAAARLRKTLVGAPPPIVGSARDAYRALLESRVGDTHAPPAEPPSRGGRDPSGRLTGADHGR